MALRDDVDALIDRETTITGSSAKVARMSYTETAYTNGDSDNTQTREIAMNGVATYDESAEQNIPIGTPSAIGLNESVVDKGIRSGATIVKQNSFNHFWGRVSYNLNKIHDWFKSFLTSFKNSLGTANGIATLDGNGRIPYSQLPESAMEYMGSWNAYANAPYLEDANVDNVNGQFYIVSVAGTQTFDGQSITFKVNDRIICKGTGADSVWQKLSEGNVIDVKQNGISLVGSDGVANLIPYFSYIIDSQEKFNNWVNNVTTNGQDYTSIAIIGGKGSGANGEYVLDRATAFLIPDITFSIKGFNNAKLSFINGTYISIPSTSTLRYMEDLGISVSYENTGLDYFSIYGVVVYKTEMLIIKNCKIEVFCSLSASPNPNSNAYGIYPQTNANLFILNSQIFANAEAITTYTRPIVESVGIYNNGAKFNIDNCLILATASSNASSSSLSTETKSRAIYNAYGITNIQNSTLTANLNTTGGNNSIGIYHNSGTTNANNLYIDAKSGLYATDGLAKVNATNITFSSNVATPTTNCGLNQQPHPNVSDYKSGGMDLLWTAGTNGIYKGTSTSLTTPAHTNGSTNGITGTGVTRIENSNGSRIPLKKPITNYNKLVFTLGSGGSDGTKLTSTVEFSVPVLVKMNNAVGYDRAVASLRAVDGSSSSYDIWINFYQNSSTMDYSYIHTIRQGDGDCQIIGIWGC